jgi:hypothetical protein
MSPVSPGAYCRDGGGAMTLRRIAAEVTRISGISSPGFRPARQSCAASLQFEPGAWAWVEAQPDNDQSGLTVSSDIVGE